MRIASAIFLLAGSVYGGEPRIERDVPYAEPKTERQTMDVYWSAEGRNRPIVVWIHGGGFSHGNKSEVDHKPQAFVERGYVFASMNYRLKPAATVAEMAADVAKCVRRLQEQAGSYGGDRRTFILLGHSAGAQLAALVATDERYLRAEGVSLADVRACVPVDGRYVLERGGALEDTSPAKYLAKGKQIPPFLILYHDLGKPESAAQSLAFVEQLQKVDVTARLFGAQGKDHTTINRDLGTTDDPASEEVWKFLAGVLGNRTADEQK